MINLVQQNQGSSSGELSEKTSHDAFTQIQAIYDSEHAGFGDAPKFPTPHKLNFLLQYYEIFKQEHALEMAIETLDKLRLGGIYDQVGNGFHRYSTDDQWLLPHFEKMLYDQSQLIWAYAQAYKLTKNDQYKKIIKEISTYVERELRSKTAGFIRPKMRILKGKKVNFMFGLSKNLLHFYLKKNMSLLKHILM